MRAVLDKIPYSILAIIALMLLLAPFRPMPHVVEKLIILKNGTLHRPIDIFDSIYHTALVVVILLKLILGAHSSNDRKDEGLL